MKLKVIVFVVGLGFIFGNGHCASRSQVDHEYREMMFVNATNDRVEIGFTFKRGRHSPSTFQSSGFIPASQTKKLAVRINQPMTAKNSTGSAFFTATPGDKIFKISTGSNGLVVTKALELPS